MEFDAPVTLLHFFGRTLGKREGREMGDKKYISKGKKCDSVTGVLDDPDPILDYASRICALIDDDFTIRDVEQRLADAAMDNGLRLWAERWLDPRIDTIYGLARAIRREREQALEVG